MRVSRTYRATLVWAVLTLVASSTLLSGIASAQEAAPPALFQLQLEKIDGTQVSMSSFTGKVILVVNTASRCGFTPQYKDLQVLYERYGERGFVVLGFPSNDFRNQEPGPDNEIAKFCKSKFGVTFPLFKKGSVTEPNMQPFYWTLLRSAPAELKDPPAWNFEKILLNRSGVVVARFGSFVNPLSDRITSAIERELAPPAQTMAR
jgi:glutathione peroxidase